MIGRFSAAARRAAFDPLSLTPAAWYDPSALSTLAQNSDGTGAVAVGDPVGRIMDKSGNARHAVQATAANRPILRLDSNGRHYLEFDGTTDDLVASWSPTAYPLTLAIAARTTTATGGGLISLNQSFSQYKGLGDNTATASVRVHDRNAANLSTPANITAGANHVLLAEFAAASFGVRVNRASPASLANSNAFGTPTMLRLGSLRAGGPYTGGRIYGAVALAAELSASQRSQLIWWLAGKAAVTL